MSAICVMPGHPLLKTRSVGQTFPYDGHRPLGSLRAAIAATQPCLVIPCDDRGVQHLHQLFAESFDSGTPGTDLALLIERSLGCPESFSVVSARYDLVKIAEKQGIRVAHTSLIKTVGDLKAWREKQPLPWVLKVDGTWGGRGVRIANTVEQAEKFFLELTRARGVGEMVKQLVMNRDRSWLWPGRDEAKPSVIVQSHISGRPANCAVVCSKGRVLAGIGVEVVSSRGEKGPANVVRVVESRAMMSAAERLAGSLGLSGFFGLDFMIENGSDATYLIEMNPRCTPLCHLQLGKGQDMIEALWAQVSAQPFKEIPPVTQKDMIAYFPQALNCGSETLEASFLDRPDEDPELVQELLHPWAERSLLGRLVDSVRELKNKGAASSDYVFSAALSATEVSVPVRNMSAANSLHR